MFCGNCGAQNPDDAVVCGSCGAPMTPEVAAPVDPAPVGAAPADPAPVGAAPAAEKAPMDKNKIIALAAIVAGAVVAIALLIFIITRFVGGSGPKAVVVDYVKACSKANGGKTVVSLVPKEIVKEILEQSDDFDTKSELITEVNDILEDVTDSMEDYYGKYKVKVEVRKVDDWKNSKIKEYNDRLDDEKIDMKVQDGADVSLKITIDGKDDKATSKPTLKVIKVGGKWYMDQSWYNMDFDYFSAYDLLGD